MGWRRGPRTPGSLGQGGLWLEQVLQAHLVPGGQCPVTRGALVPTVSGGSLEAEQELQAQFRAVLRWPERRTPLHHMASLGLGLALGFMALVLLLV